MPKKTKKKETEGFGEDNLVEKEEEEKLDLGDEPIDPIELGDDEDDDPDDLAERGLHIIDGDENPLDLTDDDLGNEGVEDEEDEEAGLRIVYVSGEESVRQLKLRADRLSKVQKVEALCETDLERIVATVEASQPDLVIIDSVQTLSSSQVNGVVGGVSQVAYTTNTLLRLAKATGTSVVLIGHVTKEGVLAGPKTLEHMVDTVLYLEGERLGTLRLLRCVKNRFGSTGEVGVFEMREDGLREVLNPAGIFLEHRTEGVPGTCVTAILEGNKVLLLEVQALTNSTSFGYPRRTASGFDANRLQLLLAIMEKRMGVKMSALDVYVNVAGGFKLEERAADLPVVLAVLSSVKGKALSSSLVAFGEVGLAGEVRGVAQVEKRLKEIEKLGFSEAVCPALPTGVKKPAKLKIQQVKYINFLTDFLS
jgi:DNA repair protein RadA/Sms